MESALHIAELPGLRVTVDNVVYEPRLDAPPDRPHPFIYYLTIHNDSAETVHLAGRKWVVTDLSGRLPDGGRGRGHRRRASAAGTGAFVFLQFVSPRRGRQRGGRGVLRHRGQMDGPVCVRVPAFALRVPR